MILLTDTVEAVTDVICLFGLLTFTQDRLSHAFELTAFAVLFIGQFVDLSDELLLSPVHDFD